MADAADKQFVDYLHQKDVATLVDDLLAVVAEEKPVQPLSSIYKAVSAKVRERALDLARDMPPGHDLTSDVEHRQCADAADGLLELYTHVGLLAPLEEEVCRDIRRHPTLLHIAVKAAKSKLLMDALPALHCTVVFAMMKEQNRMQPKSEHENGEDFVRRKVRQLSWLFADRQNDCSWDILAVDDGCPNDSAAQMQRIIDRERYQNVKVIRLADGIKTGCESLDLERLFTVEDSVKGGSIVYGLHEAVQQQHPGKHHCIIYTDADMSTDLRQSGLAFHKMIVEGYCCSIGSRFGCGGGVNCSARDQKTGGMIPGLTRENTVHLSLRHRLRQRVLPPLDDVVDTQSGFTGLMADSVRPILHLVREYKLSFDMEFLMQLGIVHKGKKVMGITPITWVASVAESNFGVGGAKADPIEAKKIAMENWHSMFGRMVELHDQNTAELASFLCGADIDWVHWARGLSVEQYGVLVDSFEKALAPKDDVPMPEPTVMRSKLHEVQSLGRGEPLPSELVVYQE